MRDKVILENGGTLRSVQTAEKIKKCVIKLLIKVLLLQNKFMMLYSLRIV